jgi:hypothetical protein
LRSHTYTDDLERQGDPQPGMSRHHREWNAENGVREPAADLSRMAEDVRNRLIDRVGDIGPGDRVTARLMLEAVGVIREATLEIERIRMNTGCARQQHSTQYCAEALDAQRQLEKLRAELRTYTDGTNDEVQREAL